MTKYKREIRRWAKLIGPARAQRALIAEGIGISVAEKLCKGTYKSEPKEDAVRLINRAMKNVVELSRQRMVSGT